MPDKFGIFYSQNGHKIELNDYVDINIRCEEDNCDNYDQNLGCKELEGINCSMQPYYGDHETPLRQMIKSLIDKGFKYLPIYDHSGDCVYFDKNGNMI
jgi:hypothetical protein